MPVSSERRVSPGKIKSMKKSGFNISPSTIALMYPIWVSTLAGKFTSYMVRDFTSYMFRTKKISRSFRDFRMTENTTAMISMAVMADWVY